MLGYIAHHQVRQVRTHRDFRKEVGSLLTVVDAFQRAVEDARRDLSDVEGHEVTISDLIARSSLPASKRSAVYYHLNPSIERKRGHRVPAEIVRALADVLPVSEDRLAAAAQEAAGFEVVVRAPRSELDLPDFVVRYLEDLGDDQAADDVAWQVIDAIQRARRKGRKSRDGE